MTALDARSGAKLWTFDAGGSVFSSAAYHDGTIYVGANGGKFFALDEATGKPKWTLELGGDITATPAIAGGRIIVPTTAGELFSIK